MATQARIYGVSNLGQDGQLRHTEKGHAVVNLSFPVQVSWDKNDPPIWVQGSFWGNRAEKLAEYLVKGVQFQYVGTLDKPGTWLDKNTGEARAQVKMRLDDIQLLGGGNGKSQQPQQEEKVDALPPVQTPSEEVPF